MACGTYGIQYKVLTGFWWGDLPEGERERPLGRGKYQLRPTVKELCHLRHQMCAARDQLDQLTWIAGGGEFHQSEGPSAVA